MITEFIFIDLLIIQCAYLLLHDLIDLYPLNDIKSMRQLIPLKSRIFVSIENFFPALIALILAIAYFGERKPLGVGIYLTAYFITYLAMSYYSWYKPYFKGAAEDKKESYRLEYGQTHQLLPPRGDNPRPNTLHLILHLLFIVNTILMIAVEFNFVY